MFTKKILYSFCKRYHKRRKLVWGIAIFLLLVDCLIGFVENQAVDYGGKHVFSCLRSAYSNYYSRLTKEKKETPYLSDWDDVFKGKKRIIPYLWEDRDYIIPAPASINYIRKLLYKRQAAYLLFDMNNASEKIQNDPNTIIIATPYPYNGGRKVYTVGSFKNLSGDVKYWMTEDEFQKQLKKQYWNPVPKSPTPGFKVPDDIAYELHIVRGL